MKYILTKILLFLSFLNCSNLYSQTIFKGIAYLDEVLDNDIHSKFFINFKINGIDINGFIFNFNDGKLNQIPLKSFFNKQKEELDYFFDENSKTYKKDGDEILIKTSDQTFLLLTLIKKDHKLRPSQQIFAEAAQKYKNIYSWNHFYKKSKL